MGGPLETHLPAIDAHAHVFLRGLPLAPSRRYAPNYDAPLEQYLDHLDRHDLTHGLLVQPSFLGDDNSFLVATLKRAPARLRGIAVVDTHTNGEQLQELDDVGIVGIRLNLVGASIPDLGTPEWAAVLDAVRLRLWSVEIQRSSVDVAGLADELVQAGLEVVLDHFALPAGESDANDPGFARVLALGASRKVWIKLSAPYRSGRDGRQLASRAYPRLRDAFGADRLMWGSDWPHTGFESTEDFDGNHCFLHALIPVAAEREQILASPRELFKFSLKT